MGKGGKYIFSEEERLAGLRIVCPSCGAQKYQHCWVVATGELYKDSRGGHCHSRRITQAVGRRLHPRLNPQEAERGKVMARYVLLSFDNDQEADEFVAAFQRPGGAFYMGADGHFHQTDEEGTFVRAMYQKPTKFCDCGTATGLPFARKSSYTRSLKYGWMVHTQCKKPTTNWASGEGWYAALGTNLLPITGRAPEWRG